MNKKSLYILFLIYLEGHFHQKPKQERQLFSDKDSKRLWDKIFKTLKFKSHIFKNLPKRLETKKQEAIFIKIIDGEISKRIRELNSIEKDKLSSLTYIIKILVTGDHDEKDLKTLNEREKFAKLIKNKFPNHNVKIVLKRDKKFKIESLMSALINQEVNKKKLKEKIGHEYPTLRELMQIINIKKEKEIVNFIVKQVTCSDNLILKAVYDASKDRW